MATANTTDPATDDDRDRPTQRPMTTATDLQMTTATTRPTTTGPTDPTHGAPLAVTDTDAEPALDATPDADRPAPVRSTLGDATVRAEGVK